METLAVSQELKKKKKNKYQTVYVVAIMLSMCFFCSGTNTMAALLVLALCVPLILKAELLIAPILFSTVYDGFILLTEGQSIARYLVMFFIVGTVLKLLAKRGKIKADFWLISTFLIICLVCFTSFYGIMGYSSFPVSTVFNMLFFYCVVIYPFNSKDKLISHLWLASLISLAYGGWFLLRNGLDAFDRGKIGTFEGNVNANQIGIGLAFVLAFVFSHFLTEKLKSKTIHIIALGFGTFLLFLTGSRTSLIALMASIIVTYLYWVKIRSLNFGKAFGITVFLSILGIIVYYVVMYSFPVLMERFTVNDVVDSGGSGRLEVWITYLVHYFPEYWLFGIGYDPLNMYYAIEFVNAQGHGAHNILIEILSSTGIVGLAIYSATIFHSFKDMVNETRKDLYMLIPITLLTNSLVVGIGENVISGRFVWMAIAFGVVFIELNKKERGK